MNPILAPILLLMLLFPSIVIGETQTIKTGELFFNSWDGPAYYYHENGQLWFKGELRGGRKNGRWIEYNKDGSISQKWTGTYKNGVKVK
jgi:antitoxin component YwqK of YwqJK toxin-antitoxin module